MHFSVNCIIIIIIYKNLVFEIVVLDCRSSRGHKFQIILTHFSTSFCQCANEQVNSIIAASSDVD
jgi:hypothetical protein